MQGTAQTDRHTDKPQHVSCQSTQQYPPGQHTVLAAMLWNSALLLSSSVCSMASVGRTRRLSVRESHCSRRLRAAVMHRWAYLEGGGEESGPEQTGGECGEWGENVEGTGCKSRGMNCSYAKPRTRSMHSVTEVDGNGSIFRTFRGAPGGGPSTNRTGLMKRVRRLTRAPGSHCSVGSHESLEFVVQMGAHSAQLVWR